MSDTPLTPTEQAASRFSPEPPVITRRQSVAEPFIFHGNASEYFRIWIVNTLLTILTFGIFAAWAKVRKRRYLRGSLELLNHRFDYLADPRRLLIGNLIVVIFFLCYSMIGVVYPVVQAISVVLGLLLLPWIVTRSLGFNAHNTAYRGMRFRFQQQLSPAFLVYLLKPLLIGLTLGLYYPAWVRARKEYAITRHRLGDAYFMFNGKLGPFYLTYFLAGIFIFAALFAASYTIGLMMSQGPHQAAASLTQLIPFLIIYGLGFYVTKNYIHARLFNHIWNHTQLDEHRFKANLHVGKWIGLQLTNLGAIIISCGLLYPWTVIRSVRLGASSLALIPDGSIDDIQLIGSKRGSAVGDTAAEFIGLDFGL